jgi:hypothetical protein
VIAQTTRRVWQGEQVLASEKIVSLFESDTARIREDKPGKPTEFGRCVWLDEVEAASSAATQFWTAIPTKKPNCHRAWSIPSRSLASRPCC